MYRYLDLYFTCIPIFKYFYAYLYIYILIFISIQDIIRFY